MRAQRHARVMGCSETAQAPVLQWLDTTENEMKLFLLSVQ